MGWNLLGQRMEDLEPEVGKDGARRTRHGGEPVQAWQRASALLRQRCARVADCIRSSTEVTGGTVGPEQRAARGVPWLGLLLWMFACAALFVSLMLRPGNLDGDRRVAASSEAGAHSWERSYPVRSWTRPAGELSSSPQGVRHRVERSASEHSPLDARAGARSTRFCRLDQGGAGPLCATLALHPTRRQEMSRPARRTSRAQQDHRRPATPVATSGAHRCRSRPARDARRLADHGRTCSGVDTGVSALAAP
jgi:hypothetical protein